VRIIAAIATLSVAILAHAHADDAFYLGAWRFDSAVVAPWADPGRKPDPSEKNALMGKSVIIAPTSISGPKVFACRGPHFKLSDVTADMLFQGAFGGMHDKDNSADPQKIATSLGFAGTSFKTLATGCEIDWHFVNPTTAEIGLNDYVYTLKRQ
jgi:hypothetical protein